ncbi:MBL fold metallo-hydrolase [Desulfatirhabdium butyrativorans]|uniref:MBL fold metallo-hydrolase n=1 Tax=Desulfatirhabdium butyrativorans TaxID=340467 RepID=UPI000552C2B3|nr:MBL fold metallo-hydrolase [Desulfatirhabdium butyrativorans]
MADILELNLDMSGPVRIARDVYWVGSERETPLHANPYLIVDGGEAVIIDGGSRLDFPAVMTKILETGVELASIRAIICQHYDPDLCAALPHFEDLLLPGNVQILTSKPNVSFIRHYGVRMDIVETETLNHRYPFSSGRTLQFIPTPYAHSAGSFMTYDLKTGVLFTGDLFGSSGEDWKLFLSLNPQCQGCTRTLSCNLPDCPVDHILSFHRTVMTSNRALRHAVHLIQEIPALIIAPQHGGVLTQSQDIQLITDKLLTLDHVGIDGLKSKNNDVFFGL